MSSYGATHSVAAKSSSTATRTSSWASGIPTQRWMPQPKARWVLGWDWPSTNSSGSANRCGSRLAPA